ncbi:MAG: gamma-glutamyltransferase [Acidobacteriaceae bacterium]|nr:gamma-glutamyltransferase [Acidobacteriaceae bacterium]
MSSLRFRACIFAALALAVCSGSGAGKEPISAKHGMVVAQEPIAADVGLAVLEKGGNAVDAAIATGFALAVTHPVAGNIGGGGFMLIRLADGTTDFLDFRETAPQKAARDMYIGPDGNATKDSIFGWRSSGVPGSVAGFAFAQKRFGSKKWADLVNPAARLAADGFTVTRPFAAALANPNSALNQDTESKRIFLRDGNTYKEGETLRQPELAETLERIASQGPRDFYEGETARRLVAAMTAHGGLITAEDLKDYKVIERRPLEGQYKAFHIITSPPPSAGGIGLLQMFGMLDGTGYSDSGADSPKAIHYEAEAMRRFYADRSEYLGDPDYYNVPLKQLLNPAYIAWRRGTIDPTRATPSTLIGPGLPKSVEARVNWYESTETTHYNVVDSKGNAVAVTYTLNNSYGNGITVPGLGFLLNDEMDDFAAKPGSPNMFGMIGADANAIEPGKRPLSSMTPTIITKANKLFMVVGAPGGSRITNGVMQVILDVLDFGMNPQDAVDLPRFHHQWKPDLLYLESGFSPETETALKNMGYDLRPIDNVARVEAIVANKGVLEGGTESRLHGKVSGY